MPLIFQVPFHSIHTWWTKHALKYSDIQELRNFCWHRQLPASYVAPSLPSTSKKQLCSEQSPSLQHPPLLSPSISPLLLFLHFSLFFTTRKLYFQCFTQIMASVWISLPLLTYYCWKNSASSSIFYVADTAKLEHNPHQSSRLQLAFADECINSPFHGVTRKRVPTRKQLQVLFL